MHRPYHYSDFQKKVKKNLFYLLFQHMDVHVVIAHLNALFGKAVADVLVQVKIHIPVIGTFAPDTDDIVDNAVLVGAQADKGFGIGQNSAVPGDGIPDGGLDILRRGIVGRAENVLIMV